MKIQSISSEMLLECFLELWILLTPVIGTFIASVSKLAELKMNWILILLGSPLISVAILGWFISVLRIYERFLR